MSSVACWRLRRVLTRYVDGELAHSEAVVVRRHLERCDSCRHRARVEHAVREDLRERTARAGSSAWLSRPAFPAHPPPTQWHRRTVALATGLAIVLALWSGRRFPVIPLEAVGTISDSNCNGVHHPEEAPDVDPPNCVLGCIKKGAHYVFVAGATVYTIRNQDFADLVPSAGRTVHISGTRHGEQLTLLHVMPVR